jgi:hypothetical protein
MARELSPIDSKAIPQLLLLAEEVHQTGKPRRVQRDHEDIARLVPIAPPRRRRRGRPTSAKDPLWNIVGMVTTDAGPTDVPEHVDRYLADAHTDDTP